MGEKWRSIILAFFCVGFILGSIISFTVPYQHDDTIVSMSDLGVVDGLTVPYHALFPLNSYNQSIDITLFCTDSSLDIFVLESTDWDAYVHLENYSAYFEAKNVTSVLTTVEINPPSNHWIDIMLQTKYGGVNVSFSISSHWLGYDITSAMNSLLIAIPFGVGTFYYYPKKSKNDSRLNGPGIS